MKYNNLVEVLLKKSNVEDKGITFIFGEGEQEYWTYKELLEKAKNILGQLQIKNVKKDDKIVFCVNDNRDFTRIYWGSILGGIIPIPVFDNNITTIKERLEVIYTENKDMKLVMSICDRICVLNQGNMIAKGIPSEVQQNKHVVEAYLGEVTDYEENTGSK